LAVSERQKVVVAFVLKHSQCIGSCSLEDILQGVWKRNGSSTFRREATLCLLKGTGPAQTAGASRPVAHLPEDVRQANDLQHERVTSSQGRCRMCMKNTTIMCRVCNVRLHTDKGKSSFLDYHKRNDK